MNEKGNFILMALGIMLLAVFVVPTLMFFFPPVDIIVKILLIFMIFNTVRGFLGNGVLTLIISGILIYILVIKWWWVGAAGYTAIIFATFGIFSIITWGSKTAIDLTRPRM